MAFTPDGGALIVEAFVRDSGATNSNAGQIELFNVDIATGGSRRLTSTSESEVHPFVDFVLRRLYFSRTVRDAPGSRPNAEAVALFVSDLEASAATRLTPLEINAAGFALAAHYPRASPDGEWITFTAAVPRYPRPGLRLGDPMMQVAGQIYVMRLQDRLRVRLTHFWSADQPTWTDP
jgi:Tol biopolymer transport system component